MTTIKLVPDQLQNQNPSPIAQPAQINSAPANTSGQGKEAIVPPEIKGWCWGAMFWGPIWAIGNRVWIGLLVLIPYVGLIMGLILGLKGKEWAWKAKHWDNVEHFNKIQRRWAIWGLVIYIIAIVMIILIVFLVILNPQGQDTLEILNY